MTPSSVSSASGLCVFGLRPSCVRFRFETRPHPSDEKLGNLAWEVDVGDFRERQTDHPTFKQMNSYKIDKDVLQLCPQVA